MCDDGGESSFAAQNCGGPAGSVVAVPPFVMPLYGWYAFHLAPQCHCCAFFAATWELDTLLSFLAVCDLSFVRVADVFCVYAPGENP